MDGRRRPTLADYLANPEDYPEIGFMGAPPRDDLASALQGVPARTDAGTSRSMFPPRRPRHALPQGPSREENELYWAEHPINFRGMLFRGPEPAPIPPAAPQGDMPMGASAVMDGPAWGPPPAPRVTLTQMQMDPFAQQGPALLPDSLMARDQAPWRQQAPEQIGRRVTPLAVGAAAPDRGLEPASAPSGSFGDADEIENAAWNAALRRAQERIRNAEGRKTYLPALADARQRMSR